MTDHRGLTLGVTLVGVGVYALLARSLGFEGPGPVLFLLGAILFALSAFSGFRGPLLPAGILLGLGSAFLLRRPLENWMPPAAGILLGLGSGFLLVAAIDRAVGHRRQPPPAVPGIILAGIALAQIGWRRFSLEDWLARLEPLWPFAVLGTGFLLIVLALRKREG